MAQLSQNQLLKYAEPVEAAFGKAVDSLLLNLVKHITSGSAWGTATWEVRKLTELGQLNRESLAILREQLGTVPRLVKTSLRDAVSEATDDVEPLLKKALKAGKIKAPAAMDVLASDSIKTSLTAFQKQATDSFNLVSTTMLQSTLDAYKKAVTNISDMASKLSSVQKQLNTGAAQLALGTATRQQVMRDIIRQLNADGLTGFIDKAGRKWSPEAYVNMDMRTTSHNTAIEAIKLRQQDYDADIFRVSRHSGARPLCYPYQGKYYTWGTGSGTFTDGDGRRHTYRSIYSTSYGKPAGLFGINCGHYPEPMIPGVSIPTEQDDKESKEENDRIYAESQEQRALERRVRYAKREAAMYDAAGDKEAFTKASQKVKNAQADYNAFCKETGRKKRLDRTQVYGYNKSVSSKATAAVKQAETAKTAKSNDLQEIFKANRSYAQKSGSFDIDAAKDDYAKFVDITPERVKPALKYAFDNTPFVKTSDKDVVFAYSHKQESILYNPNDKQFNDLKFGIATTHELGHRVDDMFKFTANNKALSAAIDTAAKKMEDDRSKFVAYSWENDKDGFLSDIFSAIDKSDVYTVGHPTNYWQKPGKRESEIYANLFSLEAVNDEKKLKFLRENFPEIMQEYDKMEFEV